MIMSKLTLTEKEHWKTRIQNQMDKKIDGLLAKEPELLASAKDKANIEAHKSLGIGDLFQQEESRRLQIQTLEKECENLQFQMKKYVLGESCSDNWEARMKFEKLLNQQKQSCEQKILTESATGSEYLSLQKKKDQLIDAVFMATTISEIKDLLCQVTKQIGKKTEALQPK